MSVGALCAAQYVGAKLKTCLRSSARFCLGLVRDLVALKHAAIAIEKFTRMTGAIISSIVLLFIATDRF